MDYRTQLLTLADHYSSACGLSEARIGTLAAGHGGFFKRVQKGGAVSVDVYLRVKGWFAERWPGAVDWPAGVDRPDVIPNVIYVAVRRDLADKEDDLHDKTI